MNVVLVHNSYQHPGGEDVAFDAEVHLLRRAGHQVTVFQRSNREVQMYRGVRRLDLARNAIWANQVKLDFARMLESVRPDVVHVHNTFLMISPSIYWACREAGVPVVQTLHNFRLLCPEGNFLRKGAPCEDCLGGTLLHSVCHGCYRHSHSTTAALALMLVVHRALHTSARMVDRFVALSEFARNKFLEGGLPPEKLEIKPNFVYPDPGVSGDSGEYAIYVGRLSPEKGIKTLVEAWKRLRVPVPLLIIGDGPLREFVSDELGGGTHVTTVGLLPHAEVMNALRKARLLIMPSLCYENFPMSIAEALACGVPVIASALGSLQELVAHGKTGLLVRAGDPAALAATVEWAWTNPHATACMQKECRSEYERKYTAERNYQLLRRIYDGVASSSRP